MDDRKAAGLETAQPVPDYWHQITQKVLETPLHKFLGMELVEQGPGFSRLRLPIAPPTMNLAQVLHGGVMYALLDVACYLALVSQLQPGTNAVTADIHVSVMKAVPKDAVLELKGSVTRLGRSLAFCWGEATYDGNLAATARVTKSIIKAQI